MKVVMLISTIDEGICRVPEMLMEPDEDLQYVVSLQYTTAELPSLPAGLDRDDVKVVTLPGKGLSRNRNNALMHCPPDAEIALLADDDGLYEKYHIENLRKVFRENPHTDAAQLRIETYPGEPPFCDRYHVSPQTVRDIYMISVCSPEIAFRVAKVRRAGILFDERFGAGTPFVQFGEEFIFLADCIKAGLCVGSFPVPVVRIHYQNTIKTMSRFDSRRVRVLGAVDARIKGSFIAFIKALWFSWRYRTELKNEGVTSLGYLKDRLSGIKYLMSTPQKTR